MTLADKIAEDPRQRKTAGQAVRVIDIAADPGAGHGLFENLHGFASGETLSNHLRDACLQHPRASSLRRSPKWTPSVFALH